MFTKGTDLSGCISIELKNHLCTEKEFFNRIGPKRPLTNVSSPGRLDTRAGIKIAEGTLPHRPLECRCCKDYTPRKASRVPCMESYMNIDPSIFAASHEQLCLCTSEIAEWAIGVRSLRSQENVLRWRTYLPEDCVNTMIKMGWDRTPDPLSVRRLFLTYI
jgi:hypothetical protein